jgi:hypothetical protein
MVLLRTCLKNRNGFIMVILRTLLKIEMVLSRVLALKFSDVSFIILSCKITRSNFAVLISVADQDILPDSTPIELF